MFKKTVIHYHHGFVVIITATAGSLNFQLLLKTLLGSNYSMCIQGFYNYDESDTKIAVITG